MKRNKTIVLAALIGAAVFTGGEAVRSQGTMPVPPPPAAGGNVKPRGPNLDYLAKQLDLSEDQKAKFAAAIVGQRDKMKTLMMDKSLSQDDRRAQYRQLRDDFNAQLKGFLNTDQYAKWEKLSSHHLPAPHPAGQPHFSTNAPAASK